MLSWCKSCGAKNGDISTIPDIPGILLFMSGHVGVYIGEGYAVEARGFDYGVVKTKVASRPWKNWAFLPNTILDYEGLDEAYVIPIKEPDPIKVYKLGERNLSKGCKGDDVKELQKTLIEVGYSLPKYGADGDFGNETLNAVKSFQRDYGLSVDGIYGKKSHSQLLKTLEDARNVTNFKAVVIAGAVNVRNAPSMETGKVKYVVHSGDILDVKDIDVTGWYHLQDDNYISGKYVKKA